MEISDLEPLVNAGARLLDERQPGWFRKFTESAWQDFNIRDEYHDVLGVVFGSFHKGLETLCSNIDFSEALAFVEDHGFDIGRLSLEVYDEHDPWSDLELLWREVISDRQSNGEVSVQES